MVRSSLRIAVATTDTPHHRYFLRRFVHEKPDSVSIVLNLFEQKPYPWRRRWRGHLRSSLPDLWRGLALNPYWQPAYLGRAVAAYEQRRWFPDGDDSLPSDFPTHKVWSINDADASALLSQSGCDVLFVYGTGLLKPHTYQSPPLGAINAHGGRLPGYRGLDANLWAALNGRPEDMAVTLNVVDADYDTGPVAAQRRLLPVPGLNLVTLRFHTAILCTDLFLDVARSLAGGTLQPRSQVGENRYYGPMPYLLKRRVDRILRRLGEQARATTALPASEQA